jgi:hypothetical protein
MFCFSGDLFIAVFAFDWGFQSLNSTGLLRYEGRLPVPAHKIARIRQGVHCPEQVGVPPDRPRK